jgi:hypothetical protein
VDGGSSINVTFPKML